MAISSVPIGPVAINRITIKLPEHEETLFRNPPNPRPSNPLSPRAQSLQQCRDRQHVSGEEKASSRGPPAKRNPRKTTERKNISRGNRDRNSARIRRGRRKRLRSRARRQSDVPGVFCGRRVSLAAVRAIASPAEGQLNNSSSSNGHTVLILLDKPVPARYRARVSASR